MTDERIRVSAPLARESSGWPVFVVGSARSGTTLLYSVLLSSGVFPLYRAESRIMECSTRYGRLSSERNFGRFVHDYLDSRQFARSGLDPSALWDAPPESRRSYAAFMRYFMDEIARAACKDRWVEKSPNHVVFIPQLAAAFPDARFVHAVRDGRDVALSLQRLRLDSAPSNDPLVQLVWAAKDWQWMVRTARRHGRSLGARYMEVRYEDLVTAPHEVIPALGDFLDLDLSAETTASSGVGALSRANSAFGEEISGLSRKALGRWKQHLGEEQKAALQWAIGDTLRDFGYATDGQSRPVPIPVRVRTHAWLGPLAMTGKRLLNRYTPVGRYARRPLEVGLR